MTGLRKPLRSRLHAGVVGFSKPIWCAGVQCRLVGGGVPLISIASCWSVGVRGFLKMVEHVAGQAPQIDAVYGWPDHPLAGHIH
jgi:hypothetical protein